MKNENVVPFVSRNRDRERARFESEVLDRDDYACVRCGDTGSVFVRSSERRKATHNCAELAITICKLCDYRENLIYWDDRVAKARPAARAWWMQMRADALGLPPPVPSIGQESVG